MNKSQIKYIIFIVLAGVIFSDCKQKKEVDNQVYWDIITHRTLGLAYLEENKLDEAETEFLALINLAPDESLGYANLGLVYLRKGMLDEAEEQLDRAVDLNPKDPEIRLMRSRAYELNNKPEKAIEDLEEAIDIEPEHVKSLYRLSDIYANSKDPEAQEIREKYLAKIVELDPTNISPRMNLIEIHIEKGKYDDVLKSLEEIKSLYPELPKESIEYYNKAVTSLQNEHPEDAKTAVRILHNYLKVTGNYQAGLQKLKGPGGALIGLPLITFSQPVSDSISEGVSILKAIKFTEVNEFPGTIEGMHSGIAIGDYDGDGDQDLYYSHSLLKNDNNVFTDITDKAGINHTGQELDAIFVDFDNDGFLDLFISTTNGNHLYHNRDIDNFADVTEQAGLHETTRGGSILFFDYDHEGDLDLFLASEGKNKIYQNNSDGTFTDLSDDSIFSKEDNLSKDAVFGDFDQDGDVDLFIINENASNVLYSNLRQGQYKNISSTANIDGFIGSIDATSGDYNNDGYPDIFITGKDPGNLRLLKNEKDGSFSEEKDFINENTLSSLLGKEAEFFDFDNDGFLDLVIVGEGLESSSRASNKGVVLLHNMGNGKFENSSDLLPKNLIRGQEVKVFDFNEDGDQDLLISNRNEIRLIKNDGGNINHHLKVQLVGLRTGSGKNNHFGIGAQIEMRSGDLYQMKVVTDPVLHFGLGHRTKADVVRILWTNGVPQNIFTPESNQDLVEEQILKGSCPFLYTWNGKKFVFVKDVMWRSALGMPLGILAGETAYAFPNASKEYIKIPGDLLQPHEGRLTLQVTEELWETVYFDQAELIAVDHPESVEIFADEKFTPPPFPGMEIYSVGRKIAPLSAIDDQGNDLLSTISQKDDKYVSTFKVDKYQGYTQLHDLILDPGVLPEKERIRIFLNGWIFPTDASINLNISQSNSAKVIAPKLQIINKDGDWETVIENMGFPMGKDKTVIADLTGKFISDDHRIRIQTTMQIYWDYIFFTIGDNNDPIQTTRLKPETADFHYRGYSKSFRKGGRYGPHWFDYDQVQTGQKWRDLTGIYTRYGDVTELLDESDNKYIIANAGDEVTIHFNADQLVELPTGWKRDYLIYTVGWVKDGDLNTAFGNTVEPLPFHGMTKYPYTSSESYPRNPEIQEYIKKYNNRPVTIKEFQEYVTKPE